MTSLSRSDWQGIFDKATLKAAQLRGGGFYIKSSRGNDALQIALADFEARALAASTQLARFDH